MPDLQRDKRAELILQQLEALPSLPPAARPPHTSARDPASIAEAVRVIGLDAAFADSVLRLLAAPVPPAAPAPPARGELAAEAASPVLSQPADSLSAAAQRLGFDAVRSAVLAVGAFQSLSAVEPSKPGKFNRDEFWRHSLAVGCCAQLLAGPAGVANPTEALAAGILHDIGKAALDTMLPKGFARVVEAADLLRGNIADLERSIIGLDHMVVGKRLAERWQFPASLRDCIWLHGQLPESLPATVHNPRLVNLVTLADLLVRQQHLGYSGNHVFTIPRSVLLDWLHLSPQTVEQAMAGLVERLEPCAQALGLGRSTPREVYEQVLRKTNQELNRLSGQLAAGSRRLATQAHFFDALSQFHGQLRADAPPASVLHAIAQTAVAALGVGSAGAFSLLPNQGFAETLLADANGETFQTSLVDCPQRPAPPAVGDGPVMPAGAELEWLLAAVSPLLAGPNRYWICLEADGMCIGGVVWGGQTGEALRLGPQAHELTAIAGGWTLALRTAQIREEARTLAEQLAEANRQLQSAHSELLRGRTLVSVGEMAAGAAHEMNNPLAVISGRSQQLAKELTDPKFKAHARLVSEQADRLSQILTEMMEFAKPQLPKPQITDLSDLVGKALHEAKQQTESADRTIELTMGQVPAVWVDPTQVGAAIQEVLDNALQATDPAKGHIAVHAAFDPYSSQVVLTVSDNGRGMDEQTLKHAFDPFFSARPAGRRRGMGLAKALRWMESNGGSIRLESRPERGTRTLLLLPAAPSAEPAAARKAAQ